MKPSHVFLSPSKYCTCRTQNLGVSLSFDPLDQRILRVGLFQKATNFTNCSWNIALSKQNFQFACSRRNTIPCTSKKNLKKNNQRLRFFRAPIFENLFLESSDFSFSYSFLLVGKCPLPIGISIRRICWQFSTFSPAEALQTIQRLFIV